MIFPTAGKKIIIIIIMKNEKKKNLCRKIELGYCLDYIMREGLYCDMVIERLGLYCNLGVQVGKNCITIHCIVLWQKGWQ